VEILNKCCWIFVLILTINFELFKITQHPMRKFDKQLSYKITLVHKHQWKWADLISQSFWSNINNAPTDVRAYARLWQILFITISSERFQIILCVMYNLRILLFSDSISMTFYHELNRQGCFYRQTFQDADRVKDQSRTWRRLDMS